MKVIRYSCDICKSFEKVSKEKIPMIFHTEQTEGRSTKPYLEINEIDICDICLQKIIDTNSILNAYGAQGHNTYNFPKKG